MVTFPKIRKLLLKENFDEILAIQISMSIRTENVQLEIAECKEVVKNRKKRRAIMPANEKKGKINHPPHVAVEMK